VRSVQGRQQSLAPCSGRHPPVQAFANSCTENYGSAGEATYERILRYPDGRERRIRYPVPSDDAPIAAIDAGEDWITLNAWKASRGAPSGYRREEESLVLPASPPESQPQVQEPPGGEIPLASPLALLRFLTSDAHREAQRSEWNEVCASYDILHGCPWPVPRPLYILAVLQPDNDIGVGHTLRTQLSRVDIENELTRILGDKRRENGDPIIRCGELVDGLIAFESEEEAEQYGQLLEESGASGGVRVACSDSHDLFRQVQGVQGVVVLHRRGAVVPSVHKLSAVLRGQTSLDDNPKL